MGRLHQHFSIFTIGTTIRNRNRLGRPLDFAIHPHLDNEWFPENSLANLEKLAATLPVPSYVIDDQSAIRVVDGTVDVISEGNWKLFG